MSEKEPGVVDLVDAGVPADQGLSSLGMLMQLAGNLFAAAAGLMLFVLLLDSGPGGDNQLLWFFLILGGSIARSLFQRTAGTSLLYGAPDLDRMSGIRRYIGFALIHTAVTGLILSAKFHMPGKSVLGLAAGLAVWPIALAAIVSLPRFKRYKTELPLTEDKGFEGASILMTVLGLCGAVATATWLIVMLDMPGKQLTKGPGVLIVLSLGMLVVRSILHTQAGLSGLRITSVDKSVELANRYANFGVISSFCASGALLMWAMSSTASLMFLVVVAGVCWMLMAWPMIIRRFFSDRQFADLLAGDAAPIHRRAPDAGLTSLGWLLVGHGAFALSSLLPRLIAGDSGDALESVFTFGAAVGVRSIWWSIGITTLQLWAGYELVRMSPQSRIIAMVYGAVASAVTVYLAWPLIQAIKHSHVLMSQQQAALKFGPVALQLIIPIATIVLVNRKIAPTALARFKAKPTTPAT